MPDFKWTPICDLPADSASLTDRELSRLREVWLDQRASLSEQEEIVEFVSRLSREWAIETGIIEKVYTLDRGVTETLIHRGIDAGLIPHDATDRDPVEVATVIQDHVDALEGVFAFVKGERELTVSYIKELHSVLLRHQQTFTVKDQFGNLFDTALEKGAFKLRPNNPTRPDGTLHEYCPPEHVSSEMDRLVDLHRQHQESGIPPEVEAAWLHHRFSQIHPFGDGNGRVARALASLPLVRAQLFPTVITRDERERYITTLENADYGDLAPLVSLFVGGQRRAIIGAIQAIPDVPISLKKKYETSQPQNAEEQIMAAHDLLILKGEIGLTSTEWASTKGVAQQVFQSAFARFQQISQIFQREIGTRPGFRCQVNNGNQGDTTVEQEFGKLKERYGYQPNFTEWSLWTRLLITAKVESRIVLSFHSANRKYRGVVAGVLWYVQGNETPIALVDEFFQVNYKENVADAQRRFNPWLEQGLGRGFGRWRDQL